MSGSRPKAAVLFQPNLWIPVKKGILRMSYVHVLGKALPLKEGFIFFSRTRMRHSVNRKILLLLRITFLRY